MVWRLGWGRVAREGARVNERVPDMISGTYGQEVGVYYDASEMCAIWVGAAGLAEANWDQAIDTR